MIGRPGTALTRFGKLAAVVLLLILGFQWAGPFFRGRVIQPGDSPPKQAETAETERSVGSERPPEPDAVAISESKTRTEVVDGKSASTPETPPGSPTVARPASRRYPWQEILAGQGDPVDYRSVCFAPLQPVSGSDPVAWVSDWLEDLGEGTPSLAAIESDAGHRVALQGRARLRPPLRSDVTLRLGLDQLDKLVVRAWSGLSGASLVYRGGDKAGWEGYLLRRDAGQIDPTTRQLVARDEGRWLRHELSGGQPLELRHRQDQLILSCGQTVLLHVPLQGEPRDVFLNGSVVVRGMSLLRSQGFPLPKSGTTVPQRPLPLDTLHWTGGRVQEVKPVGVTTLAVDRSGSVWAPIPSPGMSEVVIELASAHEGLDVFLGERQGNPRCVVKLLPPASDSACARFSLAATTSPAQIPASVPSTVDATQVELPRWVRFVVGCGGVRGWVSRDGEYWLGLGRVPLTNARLASVGFMVPAEAGTSEVSVRSVSIRPLPGLDMFAAFNEVARTLDLDDVTQMKDWKLLTEQSRPPSVAAEDWCAACALRTLRDDSTVPYAAQMMDFLLDWAMTHAVENQSRFELLQTAALLLDLRESHRLTAMIDRFHRLADDWARTQGVEPYSLVREALLILPLVTSQPFQATRLEAVQHELLHVLSAGQARRALAVCQRAEFDRTASSPQEGAWIAWGQADARRQLSDAVGADPTVRIPRDWEHPLVVDVHRETYNALAELQALVTDGALVDAAAWLTSLDLQELNGLAPDQADRDLWISLPLSLRLLRRQVPALTGTLNERFGDLIRLRLEEAINANQQSMVRRVADQFPGTTGAVSGYRWLGDRALISGRFVSAARAYQQALADADESIRPRLVACLRLAQALTGSATGMPLTSPVKIGELRFEPGELEELVEELADRVTQQPQREGVSLVDQTSLPDAMAAVTRSRFDGPVGDSPQQQVTPDVTRLRVPWADRQLATVVEEQRLYVSNRFHLAAYDLRSAKRLWQNEVLPGKRPFRSRDWSLTSMRPCLTEHRVFLRLLYRPSPVLVCLDKSDGTLLWTHELPRDRWFVSDPLLKSRELWVLQTRPAGPHQMDLQLVVLDPGTGHVIRQRDLIRVRDMWKDVRYCALIDLPEGFAASVAGVTFRVDSNGALTWLRRHVLVPASLDSGWVRQYFQPPLLVGDRMVLTQPGAAALECVDVSSGHLYWRCVEPDLSRWIGSVGDSVIYQTGREIGARSIADGTLRWYRHVGPWLSAACLDGPNLFVASRQAASDPPNWFQPMLFCFDALSGRAIKVWPLSELADPDPRMGPLVSARGELWTFVGRGPNDPFRDLVELRLRGLERPPQPHESGPHEK